MNSEVNILIEHGIVVTMNDDDRIIRPGTVVIKDDKIVALGDDEQLKGKYNAGRTIDAKGKIVMPGLVDTYAHAGHGMLRAIYHPQRGWPANELYFHGTTPEWWYAEGALSALERLKGGVTCGVFIVGATPARIDDPIFAERHAAAVRDVGIRTFVGVGPPDPIVSHLPRPWTGTFWEDGRKNVREFSYEQCIENSRKVIEKWHGVADGRIQVCLAYPIICGSNPKYATRRRHLYTDEEIELLIAKAKEMRELANRYDVLIHTHGARGSMEFALEKYGEETLYEILGPDVIFAHCAGLTEGDIEVLAKADAKVSWVPFGADNARVGITPAVALLEAGVDVAISTDGAAPFHTLELWRDLHRAMFLQWMQWRDMSVMPAGKALRMITIEAAKTLGMDEQIGSLEAGKKADLILIDTDQAHLVPTEMVPQLLVYHVGAHDVDTVLLDGQVLMAGREVQTVDEENVLAQARHEASRSFERIGGIEPYLEMGQVFWRGTRYGV